MLVWLWWANSYLLAAEAPRKDYVFVMVSKDLLAYNGQVVKQLAMIPAKTTIKEAKQNVQCAWNATWCSAECIWRVGDCFANGREHSLRQRSRIRYCYPGSGCLVMALKGDIARRMINLCTQQCMAVFGWGSATLLVTCVNAKLQIEEC